MIVSNAAFPWQSVLYLNVVVASMAGRSGRVFQANIESGQRVMKPVSTFNADLPPDRSQALLMPRVAGAA